MLETCFFFLFMLIWILVYWDFLARKDFEGIMNADDNDVIENMPKWRKCITYPISLAWLYCAIGIIVKWTLKAFHSLFG